MARENVSVSLSWADPTELWNKVRPQRKIKPIDLLFNFLSFSSALATLWLPIVFHGSGFFHIEWKGSLHFFSESSLGSILISPFSLAPKCICYRMKSTKSPSTGPYWHFGSQKYWSPGGQIIPLKTISMGITASFLPSRVQQYNQLRCMNCVYCIELESLC